MYDTSLFFPPYILFKIDSDIKEHFTLTYILFLRCQKEVNITNGKKKKKEAVYLLYKRE